VHLKSARPTFPDRAAPPRVPGCTVKFMHRAPGTTNTRWYRSSDSSLGFPSRRAATLVAATALLAIASLPGCSSTNQDPSGPIQLTVWVHAGQPEEQAALETQFKNFEVANPGMTVDARFIKQMDDYNDEIQTAIASDQMPDVFDVDGPYIASYAYQGALTPLDDLLDPQVRDRMLPSLVAQGTWNGHLWAVGAFDSGLALYGDRTALTSAGVRIPTGPDDAWTATEMTDALAALAANDPDGKVIDFELQEMSTEQTTYFFAPLLYSAGAALLAPDTGLATGTLDSPAAVRAVTNVADWATFADPNEDGNAFPDRRVALSWNGHWRYLEYAAALGNDLVVLPLPDLGNGTKSGQGSWAWAVGAGTTHPQAAASLVDWLTNDANAAAMSDANGAVPGTKVALAGSALYGPGKPLQMFGDNLARSCGDGPFTSECIAVPRTITPAYATVTGAFATAILTVLQGGDPQQALSKAARTIDTTMALDND